MPTHYEGTEAQRLALDTLIKLMRATNTVSGRLLGPLQREKGVTESQLGVLESLYHLGPLTQSQLCSKLLKSGSNLTTVLDNLERDGLVRRERDTADRRVQVVNLTDDGRRLIAEVIPVHVGRVERAFAALTADEQRELGRLCKKLGLSTPEG
jgi:MarR family transcriptional regulator, 2-MHQ and catechol-resistance regulon repressor